MKATRKAILLGLCMAASAVTVPTIASAGVAIDIDIAPPPLRIETVPPPRGGYVWAPGYWEYQGREHVWIAGDRKSTRLNSSHQIISYAVFCLKKKKQKFPCSTTWMAI